MEDTRTPETYEIDLRVLWRDLWAARTPVLIVALAVTVGYWAVWAASRLSTPSVYSYGHTVQFTFDGAQEGRYPDSSRFQMLDVIAPGVLSAAYDLNGLAEQGIRREDFALGFFIQPHAPDHDLIVQKYEAAMLRAGNTAEGTAELQEAMRTELDRAASRTALLSLTPGATVVLSVEQIEKILRDVPRLWSERALDSEGVADLNIALHSGAMFEDSRFEEVNYYWAGDVLRKNAKRLKADAERLEALPGGNAVKDDQSGYGLLDIRAAIDDVVDWDIDAISTRIRQLRIVKKDEDKGVTILRLEGGIQNLAREKLREQAYAEAAREALNTYVRSVGSMRPGAANTVAPHLEGERVVDLARENGDTAYLQKLTDKMLSHLEAAASLSYSISIREAILENVRGMASSSGETLPESAELRRAVIERSFAAAVSKLRRYNEILHRIYAKLNQRHLSRHGALYLSGDMSEIRVSGPAPLSGGDILLYALLLFVLFFGTLAVAMVIRRSRGNE